MLKTKVIASLLLLFSISIFAQKKLTIRGISKCFEDNTIISLTTSYPYKSFLIYPKEEHKTVIKNKQFHLTIDTQTSELYILTIIEKKGLEKWTHLFIEPGDAFIILNDSTLSNVSIYKNDVAKQFDSFNNALKKIKTPALYQELLKEYKNVENKDTIKAIMLYARMDSIKVDILNKMAKVSLKWIESNPKSKLNSYILVQYLKKQINETSLKTIFDKLPLVAKRNSWGKELYYLFDKLAIGRVLPDFIQTDTSGRKIALVDFRKKYILLVFWASWCKPCRLHTPKLIQTYQKFSRKQFEIIGISLDNSRKQWIEAIKHDGLIWTNISDLKLFDNEVSKKYGISSIPYNILIDPSGKVIAKNIWGVQLDKILSKSVK